MKSKLILLFSLILTLCFLSGQNCSSTGGAQRGIRCVSLVPSVTEIVYTLGGEEFLVGNTNQCDFPPAARKVTKVGDFQSPDLERIMMLKPGIVFVTLPMHRQVIERLQELGIRVYISAPADMDDVFAEIESVGVILGKREQAIKLVQGLREQLAALPVFTDTPKVYLEISSAPLMTVGKDVFINDVIRRAGGRNVFEGVAVGYPVIDPELVVKANPDVVLILHPGVDEREVKGRIGWSVINAVRQDRIVLGLDEDLFFRPGPRVVDGVILLARLLHPQDF